MTVVSKENCLCLFQSKEADYRYVDFRLEPSIMSRPLDVWYTANSGSSERYLWPRYQTYLTCYNKLREALPIAFSHVITPCKFYSLDCWACSFDAQGCLPWNQNWRSSCVQYPVSMRQCIIKVMAVFGQYFLQLLKMLLLGARDAHGCLVHLGDCVVISFVLSASLW